MRAIAYRDRRDGTTAKSAWRKLAGVASGVRTGAYAHVVRVTFLALAATIVWRQVATLHVADLTPLLRSYRWPQVALALAFTALSFLLLGAIEILALGTASAGAAWRVPRRHALVTAFISHAFSQSLGLSLLTGTAVRQRAYARHGVTALAVTRVTAFVTVAIALGLLSLGAAALLFGSALRRGGFEIPVQPIGLSLAIVVGAYLAWTLVLRHASPAVAAAQIGLSAFDWYLTATILFILLPAASPFAYLTFIGACVLAHTFGMLSHVPGGAGVFEATMFSVLAVDPRGTGRAALAASLIAYRLVYYLVPLAAATIVALLTGARRPQSAAAVAGSTPGRTDDTTPRADATVEWIIDNANAYDAVLRAVASARRSIWITQLAFDADCQAYGPHGETYSIAGALLAAAERAPIDVRIILNETFLLDTATPLRRFFARIAADPAARPGTIEIRGISSFPRLLHAKMVIVDGTHAFLLGSPFVNGYWDDQEHRPVDDRRPMRELGGRPLHDLTVHVTGSAVSDLEHLFRELWAPDDLPIESAVHGRDVARVVWTAPRGVLRTRPAGSTEILDALLEGIAAARSLIYIEHQYLSARPIVAALADALRRERDLEIVAVLNENADVTAYRRWQTARLEESGLLTDPRVGLFALWSAVHAADKTQLNQVFVHSKVVVVDDEWTTAGSANLDGVSLHSYGDDFTGVGRRVFRHTRNFDVNVVVDGRCAASLRSRLWSEHLGLPSSSFTERPADGWLPLWRAHASANVASLNDVRPRENGRAMRGFVLPYSIEPTPARQLAALGVQVDSAHLDVRFNPGWLEVHFSPNWVRNMFS
jgi:phosphatidylserine/phosphatidylglycerophosphate/cardiolipin synthase-like enzyme/uncharacterized membrane protein YbhN (UPF0104 family)